MAKKFEIEVLNEGFVLRAVDGTESFSRVATSTGDVIKYVNQWVQGAVGRPAQKVPPEAEG